jgi:maltooligosyltrehalose trehalohydrolase
MNEPGNPITKRKYPVGAEIIGDEINFRVWAPSKKNIQLLIEHPFSKTIEMQPDKNGYFSASIKKISEPLLYCFKLPDKSKPLPDPASRFQPQGPLGPSQVIDSSLFKWTDESWPGLKADNQIIYEMHIGTFTQEGTWSATAAELNELADFGITVIEIMPIADFLGPFGWGYDGICLFSPYHQYGKPEDLVNFIDTAHRNKLGVILDVVYNHLGPGDFLKDFSEKYFSPQLGEWGQCINFDGPDSRAVRDFYISNACYWIKEYHFDGFRFDATQQIIDNSENHIISEIVQESRAAAGEKNLYLIGENEPQDVKLFDYGLDALWNDDFHHSIKVALTGRNEAYFNDYTGTAQELLGAVKHGFIYQGQFSKWQKKRRGTCTKNIEPSKFINYIENHDQIANSALGMRAGQLTSASKCRAATAFLILGPWTPLIFQGQEFNASSPFLYFADASSTIDQDRKNFLSQFPTLNTKKILDLMADPMNENTFKRSKLDLNERQTNSKFYEMFKTFLILKKTDPVFSSQNSDIESAVLNDSILLIRYVEQDEGRLLIFNFGKTLFFSPAVQPLLAPYKNKKWEMLLSTENPEFGGNGIAEIEMIDGWYIPAECTIVLITGERIKNGKDNS